MHIDNIIEKYWDGSTTLEEEQHLKAYLMSDKVAEMHQHLVELFEFNKKSSMQHMPSKLFGADIIGLAESTRNSTSDIELIDELLESYWAGSSSDEDESRLISYFQSDDIAAEHQYLKPQFDYFKIAAELKSTSRINASEITITSGGEQNTDDVAPPQESKKSRVRQLMPRIASLAAVFVLLLSVVFLMPDNAANKHHTYAEAAEAEEALEVTMEALAFLGKNYEKGYAPMQHIKQLEKTNVFKINKAQ